jgi:O-6-methylguanine DNA methyltransferase
MAENSQMQQTIELQPFYLKDAERVRTLTTGFYPKMSLAQWRMAATRRRNKGEQLFFIVKDAKDIGGVDVTAPFDSASWRIARIRTLIELSKDDVEEIVRQIIGSDTNLYRIDVFVTVMKDNQLLREGNLFDIDWAFHEKTYYAPQVARRQIAFIPWDFGYLAVVTTPDRNKIEAIEFARGGAKGLSFYVKQAAFYHEILGMDGKITGSDEVLPDNESDVLKLARRELAAYLQGGCEPSIPYIFPQGTPFQVRVWQETLAIPYGSVRTYSEIAAKIQPDAEKSGQLARAVGQALGANPLPIVIPCHRVIGSNRDLTGFGGGVDAKAHLLQLEMWQSACKDHEDTE